MMKGGSIWTLSILFIFIFSNIQSSFQFTPLREREPLKPSEIEALVLLVNTNIIKIIQKKFIYFFIYFFINLYQQWNEILGIRQRVRMSH